MGTSCIIHNLPLFFFPFFTNFPLLPLTLSLICVLKFTDQMENWGEDGIWELTVLATCGPNSQNLPRNSRIHWKKRKKMQNRIKDWIWQPRIYSTWRTNSQNSSRFSRIHWEKKLFLKFVIFPFFFIFK